MKNALTILFFFLVGVSHSGLPRTNPYSSRIENCTQGTPDVKSSGLNHSATLPPFTANCEARVNAPRASSIYIYIFVGLVLFCLLSVFTQVGPSVPKIFRDDFFTQVGPSVPKIFRDDFFTQVGPSVPKIFRNDFFTQVGPSVPKIFRDDFFHANRTICAQDI